MSDKLYAERDIMQLDIDGNFYCRHISHTTSEKLHSKSDIAAELGWRDFRIAELERQRDALIAENAAIKVANEKLIREQQAAWPIGLIHSFQSILLKPHPPTPHCVR